MLFYLQGPAGRLDEAARHGGCPVTAGTKWAANIWIWNAPAFGPGEPSARLSFCCIPLSL